MTTAPERRLVPSFKTLRKSRGERRGSISGSEALPALEATRLEGGTASSSLHAMTEAVTALPAPNFWLVSPFHDPAILRREEVRAQVTKCAEAMSKRHAGERRQGDRVGSVRDREEFKRVAKRTSEPPDRFLC